MKRIFKNGIICFVCLMVNTESFSARALSWPKFSLPETSFLVANQSIDTRSCPEGQGRIWAGTQIAMKPLCGTFCPQSWVWVASSDGQCREVEKEFVLQRHEIIHYPDNEDNDDGTVLYSVVKVFYGKKDSSEHTLELTFTTPKAHWYCVQENPEFPFITCANDI